MWKNAHWMMILAMLASGPALAHGTDDHAKPPVSEGEGGHASALGQPGDPKARARAITITMTDNMRFSPARIMVRPGETVKLVVKNSGTLTHELVLGTAKELAEHAELMRKFPEMEHDDPNAVSVEPGKSGILIWQFTTKPGEYDFGCLVPGHFEAGMIGKIVVR